MNTSRAKRATLQAANVNEHAISLEQWLERMLRIRCAEQALLDAYKEGLIHGTIHTCIGQEASAVGVMAALQRDDAVFSNHRNHGHFLAHGGTAEQLLGEILGRECGANGGWGGSQHLKMVDRFYSAGIQGGGVPIAAGMALAFKRAGDKKIAAAFIGDGTFGEGAVYEALNLAALWKLPLLLVAENNGIAQTTPVELGVAGSLAQRVEAFGIPVTTLKHPMPQQVFESAAVLAGEVRGGKGPRALILEVPRLAPHSKGDDTRSEADMAELRKQDPVARCAVTFGRKAASALEKKIRQETARALQAVKKSRPAQWEKPVAKNSPRRVAPDKRGGELAKSCGDASVRDQLNRAMRELLTRDKYALVMGEDVLDPYGGAFKVTRGLSQKFPKQVLTTPISELAIAGAGLGAALGGAPALVELMFGDFLFLAADPLMNQAAKYAELLRGKRAVPLVVRTPMGARRGYGPTHSQTLEKYFLGMPGLRVVAASAVHDNALLLLKAVECGEPTLFVENKLDYGRTLPAVAPGGQFALRVYGAEDAPVTALSMTGFEDDAVNVLCYGGMALMALEAAKESLLRHEIACRVVVVSQLYPYGFDLWREALRANAPTVAVEEACAPFGWSAEALAVLMEAGWKGKAARVGARECVIPAGKELEDVVLPQSRDIVAAILKVA